MFCRLKNVNGHLFETVSEILWDTIVFAVGWDTETHTDIQIQFVKATFLDWGDLKTDDSIEISKLRFFHDHNTFTIL